MFNIFKSKKAINTARSGGDLVQNREGGLAKPKPVPEPPLTTEKVGLRHDASLVPMLIREHQQLIDLFIVISNSTEQSQWRLVPSQLNQFKAFLVDHLMKEGIKLYAYGASVCRDDPDLNGVFRGFKSEMAGIGTVVFDFISKWSAPDALATQDAQKKQFASELDGIGEALVSRIQREESTLYPLYDSLPELKPV